MASEREIAQANRIRDLPKVDFVTYLAVCGRRPESMAGFNRYANSSRLNRERKTIPDWEKAYHEFMTRPTR